jgi:hypothetical protein
MTVEQDTKLNEEGGMKRIDYLVPSCNRQFDDTNVVYLMVDAYLQGVKDTIPDRKIVRRALIGFRSDKGKWVLPVSIKVSDPELEERIDSGLHERFGALTKDEYATMSNAELKDHIYEFHVDKKKPFPKNRFAKALLMWRLLGNPKLIYNYKNIPNDFDELSVKKRVPFLLPY